MSSPLCKKPSSWTAAVLAACLLALAEAALGQCANHPLGKTAVEFSNESGSDLTFFIDQEKVGIVVPSNQISTGRSIIPGTHLLSARGSVADREVWVWTVVRVPEGELCRWTVFDRPSGPLMNDWGRYRSLLEAQ